MCVRGSKKIWVDAAYNGSPTRERARAQGYELEVVKRPSKWFRVPAEVVDIHAYLQERGIDCTPGFKLLPRRWVVERSFAWMSRYRRLSKDYEYLCDTSESFLFLAMIRTLLRRFQKCFS